MGKGTLPPIPMGYQPYQPDEEIPPLPSGYSAEPVKKKVGGEDLSNGGTNGSFAGLLGGSVKGANIGSAAIKKLPIEDISEYNKRFEDITGHKEINLGSDLPQIAKAREEKKYLTYRDIEEYQIKPVLNDVASGVVQSEDLKKLYQQPYGKKIVSEVINQNLPEIGTMGLDEDVFGNEKKWEAIAQSIQSKNRQQGVDAQNQQEFELDNELANSLKDYTYGQDHIAVRGGGEAVNERQQKAFGIVNTTSPSELSAALRNINNSSKVWDSEGNEVDKKLLAKKIGTRLFQIKAQEDIHPEITQLSDKVKSAISKVPVEWKKQGMTDELLNRDAEYVIDGLNYIRDSDPGRYAMIMGTIYKLDKIAETDYQELVGLGKEINSFKKFKQGEYVEKDNRNFLTPQGKKALLGGWLYEELKRTGKNKQTFRIPQKDILEAYKNVPAELKDDDLLRDIIKDEVGPAFGFLPIAKGEGIPKRGLGRQILTNTADPFAGILKTADYSFDSPFDAYLKSKELDRGDNIVLNSKGEYTNKSSDTFFNKAVGGLFSFLSQVGIARGIGAVTAKGTNALIGQVAPRAATVTTSEAALNVGTPLSVIAQQYGDEYVDFLEKTGNPTKAALGAFVSTVTQGAIERFVLPDVKIADQAALLFARKNLAKDIINVVENGGGKAGVLKTIKDFTANTLSTLSKEAIAEENLQNFANYLTEMVVSPKTAQNRDLMQETEDITKAAVVQMAIPAVLGGAGETKIKRGLNKVQLNHIGVNAEDYQKALDNQFAMGKMLQEDYDLASGIIQLHRDNIINAPKYDSKGELISAERQLEYAYQSTVQETLQKQAEKQRDKIQREPIEKKIEEADKIKRQIFYGEEAEGLPPKEGQPITIDQDRDLMDEEGQDLSKDELLATLKSKAGELEQGMDLQYFKDKAAEDPAKYIGKYGEETVMKLIESVPTETLQGNLDLFIEMNPDNPSVKILDNIIAKREQSKNPPIDQVRELADENTPNETAGVSGSALKDVETKQQIENFGVPKEDVDATHGLLNQVFSGLKKAGLTAAKTVGDWVGIGKGSEKPYSLKIGDKEVQVKNTQPEVVNGFYSPLEKVIIESRFDKLPAKQWAEKYANSEEAKWTGLKDWLNQQQGSVSKADIQQFLKDNRIQVIEVVKGEVSNFTKDDIADVKINQHGAGNWVVKTKEDGTVEFPLDKADDKAEAVEYALEQLNYDNKSKRESKPKFQSYQTEGEKSNYKEVLVTMPDKKQLTYNGWFNKWDGLLKELYEKYNVNRVNPAKDLNEKISATDKKRFDDLKAQEPSKEKTEFSSSHFDEPNILVHLRMNTRVDAEGKKVLFLEEVQSDWGQKGKKEGFDSEKNDYKAIADRFAKGLGFTQGSEADVKLALKRIKQKSNIWEREYAAFKEAGFSDAEINKMAADYTDGLTPSAPFVTDTNSWTKLGLKVALKEAVKQGADKIAWTTGEQQNDRYDLSKQVEYIQYEDGFGGTKYVDISTQNSIITLQVDKDGKVLENKNTQLPDIVGKNLSDVIGKDATEKIMRGDGAKERIEPLVVKDDITGKYDVIINGRSVSSGHETYNEARADYLKNPKYQSTRRLQGDGLKVGGKGMKGFYGSPTEGSLGIVGNVAKSLFKQEPKTVKIMDKETPSIFNRYNEKKKELAEKEKRVDELYNEINNSKVDLPKQAREYNLLVDEVQDLKKEIKDIERTSPNALKQATSTSTQHSIDITPEMKAEVEGKGQPLFKDAEAQYRIESGKNIIEAIKDFNQSKNKARATVALTHEIMHPTVVSIIDGAKEGNEAGTKHTETIVNEFNKANPNSKVTVEDLIKGNDAFKDGTTSNQYRQVQEFIAKAWEKYHTEGGKGFSDAFQKVLEQITKAFQSVYKSITGKQLTPELKQMFDDILGKEAPTQYTEAATPKEQIQENNLNLQDNGKESQNIPTKEDKGTSSSTQPSREESPEKLQKRYERVIGETDLTDPYDRVLEFFANGGKINASSIENVFGGKDKRINWKASTEGEKRSKIGLIAKDGQSIDKLADTLSRRDPKEENDSQVYKNAIEQVLLTHNSKSQMQQALVDKYDLENAYEKYMEQAYGKEAIDIVEKMSEEEINYLLQLDSEKAGEFIDDLVEKKIADEKPTIQEADTAAKQKIAELEAERDAKILKEGKPDVKLEFVSAKELVDSKDPIGNRNIHNDIKERFKKLKEILDCIHG